MSAQTSSREQVLQRVRAATRNTPDTNRDTQSTWLRLPRDYVRHGSLSAKDSVELMVQRLREYDADVIECTEDTLPAAIAAQLRQSGKRKIAAPSGLPSQWIAPGFDWVIDGDLATAEIEQAEGVVTTCSCGIADSGTIVLHHGAAEGRRVLSLLPDWHLCILRASQIVETLPEYFSRCEQPPAIVTWISGPSATADIEMTRIRGVHGPRFLQVILVQDQETT